MKIKNFILKIVNLPKLIKRLWIILWLSLFILVAMKLCFNIWYPIIVENAFIINICNFIDDNKIIKIILYLVFYILNGFLILLIYTKQKRINKITLIVYFISLIIGYFLKNYSNILGIVYEILIIIYASIYNLKNKTFKQKYKNVFFPIIIYFLINIWQLNIFFIRGIENILTNIPSLINLVLQIDYYIFLLITWIGVSYMGVLGFGWLWGKSETELLALKEEELKKEKPDEKLIEQIDKKLEELKYETSN